MVRVEIVFGKETGIRGFTVKGHAYSDVLGKDIVCSAVSALAYTAVGSMMNLVGDCVYEVVEGKNASFECFVPDGLSDDKYKTAKIILDSMHIGFKQIEVSYPEFVKVCEEEV